MLTLMFCCAAGEAEQHERWSFRHQMCSVTLYISANVHLVLTFNVKIHITSVEVHTGGV